MFIASIQGLLVSVFAIAASVAVAYRFKPAKIETRFDKIVFVLFGLAVFSSVWGTVAPKIGSAITVFRVAILLFWALFCWKLIKGRENPFTGLSSYHWVLAALLALLLANGAFTLLFNSPDRGYTLSHLVNLCFDFLLCAAVFFYARMQGVIRPLMMGLTVTVFSQMAVGVYECFAGPLYATTHLHAVGPNFFGLMNLHLPSVSFMNTNDYTASLFFLGMVVIVYWLYKLVNGGGIKLPIAIIVTALCGQWFVSYCGGGVLVQVGVIVFSAVLFVAAGVWAVKNRKPALLIVPLVSILFAAALQVSPSVDLGAHFDWMGAESPRVQKEPLEGFSGLGTGTDETMERTTRYRVALLEFSFSTFIDHPLGAGMGNTQKLAESDTQLMKELGNRSKLHCYLAECIADYGLPFIALGLAAAILVVRRSMIALRSKNKKIAAFNNKIFIVLLLATLPCAVLLSTAPSTAQDLKSMWIYLAILVLMFDSCTRGLGLVFDGTDDIADESSPILREVQ